MFSADLGDEAGHGAGRGLVVEVRVVRAGARGEAGGRHPGAPLLVQQLVGVGLHQQPSPVVPRLAGCTVDLSNAFKCILPP